MHNQSAANIDERCIMPGHKPKIDNNISQRALSAYLGLAIGDALGATTEFLTPNEIKVQYGVHETISGGGWLHLKPGQVTDDTEMSLALGDALIKSGGVSAKAVAESFSDWMRSKPIDIGNTVRRGIVQFRNTGRPWVDENEYDAGNGACMRSLPIAILYVNGSVDTLIVASRTQAHTTHNNPLSDAGTEAALEMCAAAMKGEDKSRLREIADRLVDNHKVFRFDNRRIENPSGYIVETLQAVFQAIFDNDDFESTLIDVVNRGGDADTTGAIAGMVAGALYGQSGVPKKWLKRLDPFIVNRCKSQTDELLKLAAEQPGAG
ncbi:MAG: ADP-ribosyl-[dinitrogen reductase] hydrolase [Candidatus Thiodiazotropha taylori]|nr:ADP-ribosyl-[dinitrogen reductase] hydrolase [Candidatus Thiodiazotropha endolucinida]MCW4228681.1 ADP-ribosyl-[dinitrogen reductase] hydrolase [Candidatus Thiodiazotropha taylori]